MLTVSFRVSVHAEYRSRDTDKSLKLSWTLGTLAVPNRRTAGVLTTTKANQSVRTINIPEHTQAWLVHSAIDSHHDTNTYNK